MCFVNISDMSCYTTPFKLNVNFFHLNTHEDRDRLLFAAAREMIAVTMRNDTGIDSVMAFTKIPQFFHCRDAPSQT